MKIKMLTTTDASPNGVSINLYKAGEVYNVPFDLGESLIKQKKAEVYVEVQQKAVLVPENKAAEVKPIEAPIDEVTEVLNEPEIVEEPKKKFKRKYNRK